MGCCNTNARIPQDQMLLSKLKDSIASDSSERVRCVLNLLLKSSPEQHFQIDSPTIDLKDLTLNPLAYSLWTGSQSVFKCLVQEFNASPIEMEKLLLDQHFTGLDIICERNYTAMFLYYIPIYLQYSTQIPISKQDHQVTVDFDRTVDQVSKNIYSPVHKACELGNISILLTIFNYFKTKDFKPHILDLEYQEETSGENCVLIACRTGNYSMIKFLFEVVKADFTKVNSKGEGPVIVLLAACRKAPSQVYFQCLVYLLETVHIDLKKIYEDCLLLAQERVIVEYLEKSLKDLGICVNKQSIEETNKIHLKPQPKTDIEMKLDEEDEFYIKDYIEDRDLDRSALSSIGNFESHIEPFISVLGNNYSLLK